MPQQQPASLIWINKDASNVHRKKHVAEVNAHVQRSSVKRKPAKSPPTQGKEVVLAHGSKQSETGQSSESQASTPEQARNNSHDHGSTLPSFSPDGQSRSEYGPATGYLLDHDRSTPTKLVPMIFSFWSESGTQHQLDIFDQDTRARFPSDDEIDGLSVALEHSMPPSLDVSNPLPCLLTNLSTHEKMLIHTHLTCMPRLFYGMGDSTVYCPVRNASVINMISSPLGTMWVLISLEMFLETVRKSTARKDAILQRKVYAYQAMSKVLNNKSEIDSKTLLIAPASAAISELFCGDPHRAVTHLNGINAFLKARGGLEYIREMEIATSMPIFAILAYRTLLQDGLPSYELFEQARASFVSMMRSFISWRQEISHASTTGSITTSYSSPQDEGFDGEFDLAEGIEELYQTRQRLLVEHDLVSKFVKPDFNYNKLGEKVDHFVMLYTLNIALFDHGTNLKRAIQFLEDFVSDVEIGGTTPRADSSIKVAGVLRLLTNRQVKMYPHQPGTGIVRAWEAIDALEIMKLLPENTQNAVSRTLCGLLTGRAEDIMSEEELTDLESAAIVEWHCRHPGQLYPHS